MSTTQNTEQRKAGHKNNPVATTTKNLRTRSRRPSPSPLTEANQFANLSSVRSAEATFARLLSGIESPLALLSSSNRTGSSHAQSEPTKTLSGTASTAVASTGDNALIDAMRLRMSFDDSIRMITAPRNPASRSSRRAFPRGGSREPSRPPRGEARRF